MLGKEKYKTAKLLLKYVSDSRERRAITARRMQKDEQSTGLLPDGEHDLVTTEEKTEV